MKRFAPYKFILGPEQLSLSPGRRVSSPAEYAAWQMSHVTRRGGDAWDSPESIKAYVNHGRWVADCFWCKTGMLTRPAWGVAYCGECGARYGPGLVDYPSDRDQQLIERTLLRRVRREQQNWDDRQSVEELAGENQLEEVLTP